MPLSPESEVQADARRPILQIEAPASTKLFVGGITACLIKAGTRVGPNCELINAKTSPGRWRRKLVLKAGAQKMSQSLLVPLRDDPADFSTATPPGFPSAAVLDVVGKAVGQPAVQNEGMPYGGFGRHVAAGFCRIGKRGGRARPKRTPLNNRQNSMLTLGDVGGKENECSGEVRGDQPGQAVCVPLPLAPKAGPNPTVGWSAASSPPVRIKAG
jgi:hypothetical protein